MSASWDLAPLRELLEVQNGYAFNAKKFTAEDGVPLIRIRDLKEGIGTETNYTGHFDRDYLVNAGDLLIGMDGEFRCHEWKGAPALLNQRVCRLRNFKDNLEPRFLYYGINKYLEEIEDATSYTTVKHLSSKTILGIEFPHPPLPEQQRIVGVLDAAFGALREAEGHVERNRANARELFESYLNGVFEGKGDGWVEKRLGDLGETRTGSTPPTNDRSNYGDYAPFVKPGDFNVDGSIDYRGDGVSKRGFELSRPIPANSILMVCVGATIGKTGFVDREVTSNQQINSLSPRSEFFPKYIYYALISRRFFEAVLHNSSQATLPIISKSKWENLTITLPKDRKVQERIANELDELSMRTKELEATYQQKLLELAGLKKAVLGAAFRGEL